MTATLTSDEIAKVTGKRRPSMQAASLAKMGVPFKFTGNGVWVVRAVAEAHALVPKTEPTLPQPAPTKPKPPGLLAWEKERRERDRAIAEERARADAAYKAEAPAIRQARRSANRAKRRADELLRCPKWADKEEIKAVYLEARRLTDATGIPHHVDHDIPLRGRLVSGLHVHNNLKVMEASENIKKRNGYEVE